jgi:hypothetical protein
MAAKVLGARVISGRSVASFVGAAVVIAYVVWSQFALHLSRVAFDNERRRALNIADQLELWKELAIQHRGRIDREALEKNARNIELTPRRPTEGLPWPPGDRLFTMLRDPPDPARQRKLQRYLSDRVLDNYFYVVIGADGWVKEMFWDKP